jgi:hypothetical protein
MPPPLRPSIYHITHVDNLPSILRDGGLLSDAAMVARGGPAAAIGMDHIKKRRLEELTVTCHPPTRVGEYVPFYFCPRSVMLYIIDRRGTELSYRGGQVPILHLEADLHEVVEHADREGRRWAFSLANAGARYTLFRRRLDQLDEIDWNAVAATDWRAHEVKEGKQAEFLIHTTLPWTLVRRIGVHSMSTRNRVVAAISEAEHRPRVEIVPSWYY